MVEIQFIDGTTDSIESYCDCYEYDLSIQAFKVLQHDGKHYAIFPREFVKSIRYIEV